MRMWSPEVNTECLSLSLSTGVFTQDLSLNLELTEWVAKLLSKPLGSPCLCPPALLWQPHNHTWPFTWELGAEVRFSFCAPSTWPYHESSLQPLKKPFVSDIFSEFSFLFFLVFSFHDLHSLFYICGIPCCWHSELSIWEGHLSLSLFSQLRTAPGNSYELLQVTQPEWSCFWSLIWIKIFQHMCLKYLQLHYFCVVYTSRHL